MFTIRFARVFLFFGFLMIGLSPSTGEEPKRMLGEIDARLVRPKVDRFETCELGQLRTMEYVVLYFSAHWDERSKKATPELVDFYHQTRRTHDNFEVVFISADKDEVEMLRYMNGYRMPWVALDFEGRKDVEGILKHAGRAIPCVAVLDTKGKVVAHSFEKGKYQGVLKPMETMKRLLDAQASQLVSMR